MSVLSGRRASTNRNTPGEERNNNVQTRKNYNTLVQNFMILADLHLESTIDNHPQGNLAGGAEQAVVARLGHNHDSFGGLPLDSCSP